MKNATRTVLAFVAVLMCGVLATESAFAQGHRHGHGHGARIGISIGVPLVGFGYPYYSSPYYYPPYYSYPSYDPAPVVQQQAPVYVEQNPQPPAQSQSTGNWYYCADSRAYYPYVKECPAGWQRVAPQPR